MSTRTQAWIYWSTTILVAVAFLGSGAANLFRAEHVAADMRQMGYPGYFMTVLGTWKVLGAAALLVPGLPQLKEWAYAGMMFDLSGAAASRAATGDSVAMVVVPLVLAVVVAVSWGARPGHRRLRGTAWIPSHIQSGDLS